MHPVLHAYLLYLAITLITLIFSSGPLELNLTIDDATVAAISSDDVRTEAQAFQSTLPDISCRLRVCSNASRNLFFSTWFVLLTGDQSKVFSIHDI